MTIRFPAQTRGGHTLSLDVHDLSISARIRAMHLVPELEAILLELDARTAQALMAEAIIARALSDRRSPLADRHGLYALPSMG